MPPPVNAKATGGRLSGVDVSKYTESYARQYLQSHIQYQTEVLKIYRPEDGSSNWLVAVEDLKTGVRRDIPFDKVVACTGVILPFSTLIL